MTFVIFLSSMSSHMVDKYTLGCSSKCAHITFKWSVTYEYIIHVCCFSFTTQIRKRKVIIAICSAKALMSKPLNNNSIRYKKTCKNTAIPNRVVPSLVTENTTQINYTANHLWFSAFSFNVNLLNTCPYKIDPYQ